jgi:hypothetical protein
MAKKKKVDAADDALLDCSSFCVSICTFCTSQASKSSASTVSWRQHLYSCVPSICTFVLVKQVKCVPRLCPSLYTASRALAAPARCGARAPLPVLKKYFFLKKNCVQYMLSSASDASVACRMCVCACVLDRESQR